jgi:hypothetical protein
MIALGNKILSEKQFRPAEQVLEDFEECKE